MIGDVAAIEALVAAGDDPRRPANLAGQTPLSDAQREGHAKAIELINEYLSGARPIGKPAEGPSTSFGGMGMPVAVGTPIAPAAEPPLHEMVKKIRDELNLPEDLPMAQVVDRAVAELGLEGGKGRILEKAQAAWKALGAQ